MSRVKRYLERKYSGGYYRFWTDVSVQELIDAGVKVYWHEHLYDGHGLRSEEAEETRWRLARSEKEIHEADYRLMEIDGKFYDGRVAIYFNIQDEETWNEVQAIERQNKAAEEAYWTDYRETGKADRAAVARGLFFGGYKNDYSQEWYDTQIAPEARLS